MALTWPHLLQFRSQPLPANYVFFSDLSESRSLEPLCTDTLTLLRPCKISVPSPPALKPVKCLGRSTEEKQWRDAETAVSDSDEVADEADDQPRKRASVPTNGRVESQRIATTFSGDSLSLGIREPVYEVVEVKSNGTVSTRKINRRQLLKSSGLRPRDIRSVDPSLFMTNAMPSLLKGRESFSRDIAASIEPQEQQWRAINAI